MSIMTQDNQKWQHQKSVNRQNAGFAFSIDRPFPDKPLFHQMHDRVLNAGNGSNIHTNLDFPISWGDTLFPDVPLYPAWVEEWNLTDIKKPNCKGRPGKGYREYGERVSRQFERYDIPFTPYALRHAYGIRGTIVEGMPESTMAAYMGHSELVHLTTYNRFASKEHHMQAYRKNILKED